ncbi:MAG: hypothetical protein KUG82_03265 [Pseudomonadales bacterium]|nr:hypothetical protein [Pseudomonadales bacterium]
MGASALNLRSQIRAKTPMRFIAALGINMNQVQQSNFIAAGAIGSFIAFFALMIIAFIPRPFISMDHFSILSGVKSLSVEELSNYKNYVALNLTFDSLYLIGHTFMWFGYASYLFKSSRSLAGIVGMLGFVSAWLDFTENEIRWSALEILLTGTASNMMVWQSIFGLSFWAVFLCSFICGVATLGKAPIHKVPFGLAVAGLFIAPLSYKFGFLPAFLWLILWHFVSGFFLWSLRGAKNA